MDKTIRPHRVVGTFLVVPPNQRHLHAPPEGVPSARSLLMGQKQRVEFLDVAGRQLALPPDEVEQSVNRRGMILKHVEDERRIAVRGRRGDQLLTQSMFDQDLRDPPGQRVHPFDQPRLYGPLPLQALGELGDGALRAEPLAPLAPFGGQPVEIGVGKASPVGGKILNGPPGMAHRDPAGVLGHVRSVLKRGNAPAI